MRHGIAVNSRNWQSIPKSLVEFLKLHRHFKMDVYFFSQGDDVDMTIKRLAQQWYKLVKSRIPFIGKRYAIAIPVVPSLVLESGDWKIKYTANKMPFANKYLPIYKTWHLFNSYDVPLLPEKQWEKWGEVYEKDNIIVKKFSIFKRIICIKLRKFYNRNVNKKFNDIFRSDK